MLARLVHGALVGAFLIGVAGLIETSGVLRDYPYHRDLGTWLQVLPLYCGLGALLGAAVALALPLITRRDDRASYPGLYLALGVTVAAVALYRLFVLHTQTLAGEPLRSLRSLLMTALLLALAGGAFLLLSWLARRAGWLLASLFSPVLCAAALALLLLAGIAGRWMPVEPAPLGVADAPAAPAGAPNVLLVVLDTVAAGHLGCYGYYRSTSPELDTIASEGVVFENAFSAAPWTLTSHASLFSGLQWSTHRTGWQHLRLDDGQEKIDDHALNDFHTLSEELGQRGYDTCCIAEKPWITADAGLTQGFNKVWDLTRPSAAQRTILGALQRKFRPPPPPPDKGAQQVIDQALDWLGGGRGRCSERPFFLFLNLNEAHGPYHPPDETLTPFLPPGVTLEAARALDQSDEHTREYECGARPLAPGEADTLRALYDGEIHYQDRQLGRLFQGLRDLNLMENTLVIVTSDHGQEFGLNGRMGHQFAVVDELVHVPLVLRYPRSLPAGSRVPHLASLVDVFPTVIEFIERETNARRTRTRELDALEGVQLLDSIGPNAVAARDFVICEYDNPMPHLQTYPCWDPQVPENFQLLRYAREIQALRTPTVKFERYGDGSRRLIDLKNNPDEVPALDGTPDPAAEEAFENRLDQQLNAFLMRRSVLLNPAERARRVSKGQIVSEAAALEQLGYVEMTEGAEEIESTTMHNLVPPPFVERKPPARQPVPPADDQEQ